MLFSYKELKKLANLPENIKLKDITKAINSIGFEVEDVNDFGDVDGIKFGEIIKISKNPNGDMLNVCEIRFEDKIRTIQTTANNLKENDIVLAFVPGSRHKDIIFSEKELKGIVSEGMLTSLVELGVNKEFIRDSYREDVMTYQIEDISIDPIKFLGLQDKIIDIDILSNRSDAQSYFVMARELAAYFKTQIELPKPTKESFKSNIFVENGLAKSLALMESNNPPIISLKEQILLAKYGIKSINDIIDLTNLTLIMTGQPTHAYDADFVGNNFKAKTFNGTFKVLGNKDIEIINGIAITSDEKPVSLAGVIGGEISGVKDNTKDFILELGIFPINLVRSTAKNAKITNHSVSQSSKILSTGTTKLAIDYLKSKLKNHSNVLNFKEAKKKVIQYNNQDTSKLAGFDITKSPKWHDTIESLEILGFKFLINEIEVPNYRHDINSTQDINEEIFRFFGYDSFKPVQPKINSTNIFDFKNHKSIISGQGYQEVNTYTLISKEKNIFNPFNFNQEIALETFVSKEREVIRNSQLYSILEVIEYNLKRKIIDISIFSKGMIGNEKESIILASTTNDFETIKKDLVNLLPTGISFIPSKNKSLHPGVSADIIYKSKQIGWIGKPHPSLSKIDAFVAEIFIKENKYINNIIEYDVNPLKSRDVTFELKENDNINNFLDGIEAYSVKVIDEFKKDGINKITVNFRGTNQQIEIIDEKFNK